MRLTILGILWAVFGLILLPPVQGSIMNDAPGWLMRTIWFLFVGVGILMVLALNPVWTRISGPQINRPFIGLAIIGASGAVIIGAAWWIFIGNHITAKLGFFSTVIIARELPGTVIAGIPWRAPYARVQLIITNDSTVPAENVKLNIRTNRPIVAMGQSSKVPDVSIDDSQTPEITTLLFRKAQELGIPTDLPLVPIGTKLDYVIRCKRLEAHQSLELTIAVIGGFKKTKSVSYTDNRYWVRLGVKDSDKEYTPGKEYFTWFGYADRPDSIYAPTAAPATLHLSGGYISAGDKLSIGQDVPVVNLVQEVIKHIPNGR